MEGFLFSGFFWGGILILWGLSIIINAVFHMNIPIFRIILAFIFVYIGLKMLWGGYRFTGRSDKNTVIFSESSMNYNELNENNEFNIIFGKSVIDLTGANIKNNTVHVHISAIFGEGIVKINPEMPVRVIANAAFAGAFTPDESITSFGQHTYKSSGYKKEENHLEIEADTVFGGIRIENSR